MSEWLHDWLEPITYAAKGIQVEHMGEYSHYAPVGGGEVLWAGISTALAFAIVLGASRVVGGQKVVPAVEEGEPTGGLKGLLYNKWYVDELYDRIIVQPLLRASRFCWRVIDATIIDGFVNLTGGVSKLTGLVASQFQTGQVNFYAFVLTLGVFFVLIASIF